MNKILVDTERENILFLLSTEKQKLFIDVLAGVGDG